MGKSTIYDEKTKQAAFELYRGDTSRPIEQMATDLEAVTGLKVPGDTIRDWRQRYSWDERIQSEIAATAPILIKSHVALARVAGLDGLAYIRDVANGAQGFDRHRYEAAKFLVEEVRPMLRYVTADDEPVLIRPADLTSDALWKMSSAEIVALPNGALTSELLESMDSDELLRLESALASR